MALEIERKYIIAMPDMTALSAMEGYFSRDITQTYLRAPAGVTARVRCSVTDGIPTYTHTEKIRLNAMISDERERVIGEEEYRELLQRRLPDSRPVCKTRHTFRYRGQNFEVDVYPAWRRTAILETELSDPALTVSFPACLRVLREVTGNRAYSNASMARAFPPEDAAD